MSAEELQRLRESIDRVDDKLLEMLNERARLARAVGSLKVGQAYRPEREAQVLRRIKERNPGPLSGRDRRRSSSARSCRRASPSSARSPWPTSARAAPSASARRLKHFGLAAEGMAGGLDRRGVPAVESGAADFGVVPVENSTEGAVGRSLDLMPQTPMKVCGEVIVRIHHNLMAKGRRRISRHQARVLARPVARAVPRVAEHQPSARRAASPWRAMRRRRDARPKSPSRPAVAGEMAAEHYGLSILAANIEDEPNNTTRFLILGDYQPGPFGARQDFADTSARNRAGAVTRCSRPSPRAASR
jgi:chorismate mutase/prephenate dehydratase